MEFAEHTADIAGARMRFREAGSGPTLLFLHGAGGADTALGMLGAFVPRMRLLVPDHPGFGLSAEFSWQAQIHDLAYGYLDLIEQLELRDVHLVGTSLGGWIALEIAVRDQRRLATLTLIGAAGISPGDLATGDLFGWSPQQRVRNLVADPALADKILAMPQSPEQQRIAARNLAATEQLAGRPCFVDPGLEHWLHRIHLPSHVIWGDTDRLFPPEYGRRLAQLIPEARFSVIERCGHLPQLEQPQALAGLIGALVG